ncbi:MAG: 1-deoxy-D-xylulose-5-phosphate reductoisomerase [Bacteroidales bacterium]|jgi:1-deoxy-D-xylulose-5-phosphate reductoisomerase|nr:1-deoxy-D-xylulose-5-phosphate reductoisomerase [Bacteroidales bacterium]
MPERIALLGSTGSIGTQALDVISRFPDKFIVEVLIGGSNINLLTSQARRFLPSTVVISNKNHYQKLNENLRGTGIEVFAGEEAMEQVIAGSKADIVLAAIVGYSGLRPTIAAIKAGKKIALANKETLVVAGEIISKLISDSGSTIIPVDSEHSAIFQCLSGEERNSVEKITLTASGGPFLNLSSEMLAKVRPQDALRHPNWNMGDKVTIDSASMMNKGLEVIEARWLFNLNPEQINVIIHPQSVIHSFVHFKDGSVKAQLGLPDMRLPILFALSYPHRIDSDLPRLDFKDHPTLTFSEPDNRKFRNLSLAYQALKEGGNKPCILNAANEVAVNAFLSGNSGFLQMSDIVEYTLENSQYVSSPGLESLESSDKEARVTAKKYINKLHSGK